MEASFFILFATGFASVLTNLKKEKEEKKQEIDIG